MPAYPSPCARRSLPIRVPSRPVLLFCLSIAIPATACGGDPGGIAWRTQFEAARSEARARNLPLLVQFTGPWCGYCRLMDRETFAKAEVVAGMRDRVIAVKIQADDREDLVAGFAVSGLPCSIFVSPRGEILARQEGFAGPSEFLAMLAAVPRPSTADEGVALAGYCPVSLLQGRGLAHGQREWSVTHQGQEYRFARAQDRDEFLRNPAVFLPRSGGRCVVSLIERGEGVAGRPEFGASYKGRLYLFADEASRKRFASDPDRYAVAEDSTDRSMIARLMRRLPESLRPAENRKPSAATVSSSETGNDRAETVKR